MVRVHLKKTKKRGTAMTRSISVEDAIRDAFKLQKELRKKQKENGHEGGGPNSGGKKTKVIL